jgi:hypothetical protein
VFALLLLGVGAAVAVSGNVSTFGGSTTSSSTAAPPADTDADGAVDPSVDVDVDLDVTSESGAQPGFDLLARFGSFSDTAPVREVFAPAPKLTEVEDVRRSGRNAVVEAAPVRPSAAAADEPVVDVSMVFVAGSAKRAVVGGRVVGVGDVVQAGRVVAITSDSVTLATVLGSRTFRIGAVAPRGH